MDPAAVAILFISYCSDGLIMKPATASSFKGVFAFFLLAGNLRPALISVGPLAETIRSKLGLSDAAAGLLPALPLPIFAGVSLFARFGGPFGIEKTLAWCLALIVAGIALRSQGSIAALFAGERVTKADEETQVKSYCLSRRFGNLLWSSTSSLRHQCQRNGTASATIALQEP